MKKIYGCLLVTLTFIANTFSQVTPVATWVSGDNLLNQTGVYGTKSVSAAGNKPGARNTSISWRDLTGNLWLMGGQGYSSTSIGFLNDLWKYTPSTSQWTWISGDDIAGLPAVYGTKGSPSVLNKPGGRAGAVSWIDASGNLWLMGGVRGGTISSFLNDLWKFNPSTNEWTWVSGDNIGGQPGIYGAKGLPSTLNKPGARQGAVAWADNAGNLWLMGGNGCATNTSEVYLNDLWKYNPTTDEWTWVSGDNIGSSMGSYGTKGVPSASNVPRVRSYGFGFRDVAGNFWMMGGLSLSSGGGYLNDLWRYNPSTNQWTWVSGDNTGIATAVYGTMGVPATTNKPGGRDRAVAWPDIFGNFWMMGGRVGNSPINDLWKFNPSTSEWTWVSGDNIVNQPGVYGTKGVPSSLNKPGARYGAVGWTDVSGGMWLLGGNGYATGASSGVLNDLWVYSTLIRYPFYRDADGDGFGDAAIRTEALSAPDGYVSDHTDCNDNDNTIWRSSVFYVDADRDGYNYGTANVCYGAAIPAVYSQTTLGYDCDDADPSKHASYLFYPDTDGDGFGFGVQVSVCAIDATSPPVGYSLNSSDCSPADPTAWKTEIFYIDLDGDGYDGGTFSLCYGNTIPTGYSLVTEGADCNDQDPQIHSSQTYYADFDQDGFGDPANARVVCSLTPPSGYVSNSTDCDDTKATYMDLDGDGFGAGPKTPCGVSICCDCNDNDPLVRVSQMFFADNDHDGYGDRRNNIFLCSSVPPEGYVTDNTDCDDSKATYADTDGDGFGSGSPTACGVSNNTDNCPTKYNPDQKDLDKDGIGDVCDPVTNVGGAINSLKSDIMAMNISAGSKNSLTNKLDAALASCNAGNKTAAVNQLNAFINEVNAKRGKELTNAQADDLLARASAIRKAIENGTSNCGNIVNALPARSSELLKVEVAQIKEGIALQAFPNPSTFYFTLRLKSTSTKPIVLLVMDNLGRLVEMKSNVVANGTYTLGRHYRPGIYFVEALQGTKKAYIKLVKQ